MKKKTVKKVTTVIAASAVAASTMITPAIAAGQSAEDDEDGKQQNQQQSKGKAAASNIKEAKIQLEAAKEANQKTAAFQEYPHRLYHGQSVPFRFFSDNLKTNRKEH